MRHGPETDHIRRTSGIRPPSRTATRPPAPQRSLRYWSASRRWDTRCGQAGTEREQGTRSPPGGQDSACIERSRTRGSGRLPERCTAGEPIDALGLIFRSGDGGPQSHRGTLCANRSPAMAELSSSHRTARNVDSLRAALGRTSIQSTKTNSVVPAARRAWLKSNERVSEQNISQVSASSSWQRRKRSGEVAS